MSAFRPSDYGYSRAFSASMVDRLRRHAINVFTPELLLNHPDPDLVYAVRRAAGVDVIVNRRARYRGKAVGGCSTLTELASSALVKYFNRFYLANVSLPTSDGVEDAWVSPVSDRPRTWRLLRRPPTEADLSLTSEEATTLSREVVA